MIYFCFLVFIVPDATLALDVNTTVGESTVLPCTLITTDPVHLENLRFYWQDERHCVLYSFNKGNEMSSHVNELYRGRITAFPQHMIRGNISVQLGKPELQDDGRVFQVFAAVFDKGPRGYVEHKQICCHTLHVAGKDKDFTFLIDRWEDSYYYYICLLNIQTNHHRHLAQNKD